MRVLLLLHPLRNTFLCRFFQNFLVWSSLKYFPDYLPQDLLHLVEIPFDLSDFNFTNYDYFDAEDINYVEPDISVKTAELCLSKTIDIFNLFFISTIAKDPDHFNELKEVSGYLFLPVYLYFLFKLTVLVTPVILHAFASSTSDLLLAYLYISD